MPSDVASAEQDQWIEICAAVRAGLAKLVMSLPSLKPEEVGELVRAIDTAMGLEIVASSYDQWLEERRANLERSSLYGG